MMSRTRLDADAYLVASPEAQHVQDEVADLWEAIDRDQGRRETPGAALTSRVREVYGEMTHIDVPYAEWVILESLVRRIERSLSFAGAPNARLDEQQDRLGEVALIANQLDAAEPEEGRIPMVDEVPGTDPLDAMSTAALVKSALGEAKELVRVEVELAREEVRSEAKGILHAAVGFGIAAAAAIVLAGSLALALVLALGSKVGVALGLSAAFAVIAGIAAWVGYGALPKKPLELTRQRLASDVDHLKEHLA